MEISFTADFDFTITEVILAHRSVYVPRHSYNLYTKGRKVSGLVYCVSGKALYTFKQLTVMQEPGEVIFLPADAAYSVTTYGDEPFCHFTINFHIPSSDLAHLIPCDYNLIADKMVVTDTLNIKALLERLLKLWEGKARGYKVMSKAFVYELAFQYFTLLGRKHRTEDYQKILPAKRLLDEQFTKNTPISELAALCGFSETHFRRLFTKTMHCSPAEYRINKRILLTKDLLLSGEISVTQAAEAAGFEDVNYFSRIFKKYTGVTPSEYASYLR